MKRIIFSLGIITVIAMLVFANIAIAEEQAGSGDTVQCAYDGMKGPKNAIKAQMDYQDKTYYFCTEEEKEKFAQEPEKYLKMREAEHEGMHEESGEEHGEHQEEQHQKHGGMMEGMGMGSGSGQGGMPGGSGARHGH